MGRNGGLLLSTSRECPNTRNDVAILSGGHGFLFVFIGHRPTLYFEPFVNYRLSMGSNI